MKCHPKKKESLKRENKILMNKMNTIIQGVAQCLWLVNTVIVSLIRIELRNMKMPVGK